MDNRVDTNDDQFPAMNWCRMKTIRTETGGEHRRALYSQPDCVAGTRMPNQNASQDNDTRCYPVKWTPTGYTNPITDYFHKYVVTDVTENDLTGERSTGSSPTTTTWAIRPGTTPTRTGSSRPTTRPGRSGAATCRSRTVKGDPGEQVITETRYFRGMHGDKLPSGTRTVVMPAIAVGNVPGHQRRGRLRRHGPRDAHLQRVGRRRDLGDGQRAVAVGADRQPHHQRTHGARPVRRHRGRAHPDDAWTAAAVTARRPR